VLVQELLAPEDEAALVERLEALDWREVKMRGQVAKRTTRHFGFDYGYESWCVEPTDPVPEWLEPLRARAGELIDTPSAALVEVLCSRYPPGAGIGWHRDAPMFGPQVVGVSLGSACRMRFQRGKGDERETYAVLLPPRSAYVLAGEARSSWQHSIPEVDALRWSITFRTLRER